MVQQLMHDPIFLAKKSEPATAADLCVAQDLMDTLLAHQETCVGLAANMIGVTKRIIAINAQGLTLLMFNPVILKASGAYQAEESCLSLLGGPRPVVRYQKIKVQYQNEQLQTRIKTFEGWIAQIIQHEVDHCNGVLI